MNDFTNYGIYQEQETDLTFPYDEESIMQYPDYNKRSKVKLPQYYYLTYLPIIYNSLLPFIKKTKDSPYFSLKLDCTIDVKLKYQKYIVMLGIKMVARLKKICFFVR